MAPLPVCGLEDHLSCSLFSLPSPFISSPLSLLTLGSAVSYSLCNVRHHLGNHESSQQRAKPRPAKKEAMRQVCFNYVNEFIRCLWVGGLIISLWDLGPFVSKHVWTWLAAPSEDVNLAFSYFSGDISTWWRASDIRFYVLVNTIVFDSEIMVSRRWLAGARPALAECQTAHYLIMSRLKTHKAVCKFN